jgi:hypothetical protein
LHPSRNPQLKFPNLSRNQGLCPRRIVTKTGIIRARRDNRRVGHQGDAASRRAYLKAVAVRGETPISNAIKRPRPFATLKKFSGGKLADRVTIIIRSLRQFRRLTMVDTGILPRLTIYNLLFAHLRNATFDQKA